MIHSPNSRFFNPSGFLASRVALAVANAPKGETAVRPSTNTVLKGRSVANAVAALRPAPVAVAAPVESDGREIALANYLRLTVAVLRGYARDSGLKGYSKLRKAELAGRLADRYADFPLG